MGYEGGGGGGHVFWDKILVNMFLLCDSFGARSYLCFFSVILLLLLRTPHVLRRLWILFWSPDLPGQKVQQRFCP